MTRKLTLFFLLLCFQPLVASDKQKLTLDEFFNSVEFEALQFSPDGNSLIIGTNRAEWERSIFRHDLWLYRQAGSDVGALIQLTQSAHDTDPHWSPDGKWIAFLSERKTATQKGNDSDDESKDGGINQLFLIPSNGGEAFALTEGEEEVHAFAWSQDSRTLYFATRVPWTKVQKDAYKKNWKDTLQYRAAERNDVIFSLDLASAIARHRNAPAQPPRDDDQISDATPGAQLVASTPWRIQQMAVSPDGHRLAFTTSSISERQEKTEEFEIYLVDVTQPSSNQVARRLTNNAAVEQDIHWSTDNRHVFFNVEVGDVSGPYRDLQPHLYWVDVQTREVQQWSKDFVGSVNHYAVGGDRILVAGRQGTEVPLYFAEQPSKSFAKVPVWPGTYDQIATAEHSRRIAFVYSALERPAEVYLAESADQLASAKPITSFNKLFTERDLPQGKP